MTGQELRRLAGKYGTPFYVFELDCLTERTRRLDAFFAGTAALCYAMKANPFLTGPLEPLVSRLEVCSQGEFHICQRLGIPREKIVLSGVSKKKEEIEEILESGGVGIFTAESKQQLALLSECAKHRQPLPVLLRVSSGNQFGMDRETVKQILEEKDKYPFIHFRGLQYYSGTQKKKPEKVAGEFHSLCQFARELRETVGFEAEEIEFGPGFPIPYFSGEKWAPEEEWLCSLRQAMEEEAMSAKITLEMGRFLAAECGTYLTAIVDRKQNEGENYLILDGGIHHVNYYGQMMAMKRPDITYLPLREKTEAAGKEETESLWNLCGSLCTVSDVLVKGLPLIEPEPGDLLAFQKIGAYSVTEGIYLFLSRDLPKVFFFTKKDGEILVRDALETNVWNSPSHSYE
ncbi:alanine racemase [Hominifimenecus sp. rT4P-3]|uniref:alanine racemase n=1 Tax=Hominifimenecus sp. rT4P-3 TaxID=3242979 RepID=UPI003DA57A82